MDTPELYVTAASGTEDLVAAELAALGIGRPRRDRGGVGFTPPPGRELEAAMRACLHLRAAMRVLWPLKTFVARDADELYQGASAVEWERFVSPRTTFAISATTRALPPLAHGPFLGQKVKDALVDRLRDQTGERPDVSREDPDVRLYVHAAPEKRGGARITVGVDVAGDSLHLRGYRRRATEAPLRETLAAALLLATGWDGSRPFLDPMCGSGTIAIEAALLAARVAPGRVGGAARRFGFERWTSFGEAEQRLWKDLVAEADAKALPKAPVPIFARDRDAAAVEIARGNAAAAGAAVQQSIEFAVADVKDLAPMDPPGIIVTNPPYGERIGGGGKGLEVFWRLLGQRLRAMKGHTAYVLVGGPEMQKALAMRPAWERRLMNGPLPVNLCRYEFRAP